MYNFTEYLKTAKSKEPMCFAVEWSERVSDALPEDTIFVDIARTDEHEDWRTITVTGGRFA